MFRDVQSKQAFLKLITILHMLKIDPIDGLEFENAPQEFELRESGLNQQVILGVQRLVGKGGMPDLAVAANGQNINAELMAESALKQGAADQWGTRSDLHFSEGGVGRDKRSQINRSFVNLKIVAAVELLQPIETTFNDQIIPGLKNSAWPGRQLPPLLSNDSQNVQTQRSAQSAGSERSPCQFRAFANLDEAHALLEAKDHTQISVC